MLWLRSMAHRQAGVNRCAIEHNRALPKVGQSLRKASLDGLPLRALRVRVMVGYVLRPGLGNDLIGSLRSVRLSRRYAQGGVGLLLRRLAQALAGFAGGQFVV